MPQLTDLTQTQRPAIRTAVGGARLQPGPGPSDAAGVGVRALAGGLEEGASRVMTAEYVQQRQMEQQQKIEQERADTLRAEDSFNQLRTQQMDLTVGPQNGFANLKAGDAVTKPVFSDWTKRFDDAQTQIASGLTNDVQRTKFSERAAVVKLGFQEDMLRHLKQQGDEYAKQVYDGTVNTELSNVTARWDSPNDINASLDRIHNAVQEMADRNGWSAKYRDGVLKLEYGKAHSAVIGQAIASNEYQYAQQWYDAHRDEVDVRTSENLERAVLNGRQKELTANYTSAYLANEDNPQVLEALRKKALGDAELGEDRQNMIVGRIQNRQYVLERRAEIEENKRQSLIQKGLNELNSTTLAGFEPTPEQFAPLLSAAKGSPLESDVRAAINLASATRQFRTSTPLQQEQMLTQAETMARAQPGKFDVRVLSAWRSIQDSQARQIKDAPIDFAVRQGLIPTPEPVDLSNPEQAAGALQQRFAIARGVAARYQAPFKPLTPNETNLLKATLGVASVEQKRNYFASLYKAAGGDSQGYMALMAQIAPDDPVTAIAGSVAATGRGADADMILRGQAILRPSAAADGKPAGGKLLPMPADKDMQLAFDNYVREAFAGKPEQRSAHYQAARAAYASLSADAGDRDTSVLNSNRWEQAMAVAIGNVQKYNGRRMILPNGIDYGAFKDGLRDRVDEVLTSKRLDESWTSGRLRDLPLENIGDGRYVFRVGDGVVTDKNGVPVIINFNQPIAPRPASKSTTPGRPAMTLEEISAGARPLPSSSITFMGLKQVGRNPNLEP